MNLYEEIEMQEKERIVDSLATENQMLQEPKTPTKEQIDKVAFELFNSDFGLQMIEQDWEWWNNKVKDYYRHKAIVAITKWEKIRGTEQC